MRAAAILLMLASTVFTQDRPQHLVSMIPAGDSDRTRAFTFEVVSIRPSNITSDRDGGILLSLDEYRALGRPLGDTILSAYFPLSLQRQERLAGAPSWVWNRRFDFVGRVAPEDLQDWHEALRRRPNLMLETMLQAALADRCRLVVHRFPATIPGFALVVANGGPNPKRFSRARPNEIIPKNAREIPKGGRMVSITSSGEVTVNFYATSMASLAAMLSIWWSATVEDRTGLTGQYDFTLTDLNHTGDPSDWDLGVVGLKLRPLKVPAENIVIDHIEYPSPN